MDFSAISAFFDQSVPIGIVFIVVYLVRMGRDIKHIQKDLSNHITDLPLRISCKLLKSLGIFTPPPPPPPHRVITNSPLWWLSFLKQFTSFFILLKNLIPKKSYFKEGGRVFALFGTAIRGLSRSNPSVGRSPHRQILCLLRKRDYCLLMSRSAYYFYRLVISIKTVIPSQPVIPANAGIPSLCENNLSFSVLSIGRTLSSINKPITKE